VLQGSDQAIDQAANLGAALQETLIGPAFNEVKFAGNDDLCFQFHQRATRVSKKLNKLRIGPPSFPLGYVAGNGYCCSAHL